MTAWSRFASRLNIVNRFRMIPPSGSPEQCYLRTDPKKFEEIQSNTKTVSSTLISLGIYDNNSAKAFVERLLPGERALLYDIIGRKRAEQYLTVELKDSAEVHHDCLVNIWYFNFIPFCGYGFLDNAMMIVVGESVDATIGMYVGISIMAAAALGNIASNLLGIGMVHYVERFLVIYFNLKNPVLSAKQMNHWTVKYVSYSGKICGLICGLVLGMFPLLFYDSPERIPPPKSLEYLENEEVNADLEKNENSYSKQDYKLETVAKTLNPAIFQEYEQFRKDWLALSAKPDDFIIGGSEIDD